VSSTVRLSAPLISETVYSVRFVAMGAGLLAATDDFVSPCYGMDGKEVGDGTGIQGIAADEL
jgi:hypothetical protein